MRPRVIFFGNGMLAETAKAELEKSCEIVFHARTKADLAKAAELKAKEAGLHGVLASFGVILRQDFLGLFEPEGIINIHPSLLPKYRGPSPIETAMLNGDDEFGVSIMKITAKMDAGPVFYQGKIAGLGRAEKARIYQELAGMGARWIGENIATLPGPVTQSEKEASFTRKLTKDEGRLNPEEKMAIELEREVRAFAGFPKSKYEFFGIECTVIRARVGEKNELVQSILAIEAKDGKALIIEELQPAGRKVMSAKAFLNGYGRTGAKK